MTIKPNHHVRINTWTKGCYDNLTGVVATMLTNDPVTAEKPGFEYSATCPGWLRVKFDNPANNGGTPVYEDIFIPYELTII